MTSKESRREEIESLLEQIRQEDGISTDEIEEVLDKSEDINSYLEAHDPAYQKVNSGIKLSSGS